MKWHLLMYCKISLLFLFGCYLPTYAKNYESPALSNSIERIDIKETIKHEQYPDHKRKAEKESEDNYSTTAISKLKASEDLRKEVSHPMEKLALTPSPVTEFPHGFVYPGTKWCGKGNIANSDSDLGSLEETDKCCRSHDHCPDYTLPGETKYNLTNPSPYSRMSCKCDQKFYDCLRRVNTHDSNLIGTIYFNLFGEDCFALDYPRKCKSHKTIFKFCFEYEVIKSAEKIYQWIPPKKYKKL